MKYRSRTNYAQIYSGDKQGYNLGLDSSIFLRKEDTPRTFKAPRIGTQGSSIGDDTASTDISAGTATSFNANVDGKGVVAVTLTLTGLTSGVLIAAALETKINDALIAAGYDARVWVQFVALDAHYEIYSQYTGLTSSVVITDALTNNVADELKIGLLNGGTEAAGTDDQDYLLYTTGGATFNQPIESSAHRSGRYHTSIVKSKKVAEFDLNTYVNMYGSAGASIDTAVKLLWEQMMGTEEITASTIKYLQGLPSFYFSLVRVSTIFGEYYKGAYVRECSMEFPGDGPATCNWKGKAETRVIAGLAQLNGAIAGSAAAILNAGETERFDAGAYVMVVAADGKTIVAGADGTLTISTITAGTHTLTLSAVVTVDDNGFIAPWNPGAVQMTARDNIFTDLQGSFKINSTASAMDVTAVSLAFTEDHTDFDNYYGKDANAGFAAANRFTATLSVTFNLSNENYGAVVQSATFAGYTPEVILGSASGRHLKISCAKWIPAVPTIDVPENGVTSVTMEGILYKGASGEAVVVEFK